MDGRWRKLADKKAGAYREATAYLCGVRDGAWANSPPGTAQAGTRASRDADVNRTGHRAGDGGAESGQKNRACVAEDAPMSSANGAESRQKNRACVAEDAPLRDADGVFARAEEAALWVRAVDATRRRLSVANRLWRLSEKYHMTEDALKIWRREALDLLILAATQLGLLRPFDGCGEPDGEGDA